MKALQNDNNEPIAQFEFDNGWTASLVIGKLCTSCFSWKTGTRINISSFAGEQEASDDEVAAFLAEVAARPMAI